MTDEPQRSCSAAWIDPYASMAAMTRLIGKSLARSLARSERRRAVRDLSRIGVLPAGWDDFGRHGVHR